MQRIDEVLSNSNVLLIFVGIIGGVNSMSKSSDIIEPAQRLSQQKISKAQQEKELLSHIKEVYFNPNYQLKSVTLHLLKKALK